MRGQIEDLYARMLVARRYVDFVLRQHHLGELTDGVLIDYLNRIRAHLEEIEPALAELAGVDASEQFIIDNAGGQQSSQESPAPAPATDNADITFIQRSRR